MRLRDTSGPDGRRTYAALRDGDPSVPVPDPRITGATASIGRVGAGEVTVLDLPASGWSGGTSVRRGFKFKSRSGAVVSARLVGDRYIRISVRGDGAYPLGGTPQGGVGIIIDVGGVRFCGFFGGTIVKDDGERFVARTAPAPASCPIPGDDNDDHHHDHDDDHHHQHDNLFDEHDDQQHLDHVHVEHHDPVRSSSPASFASWAAWIRARCALGSVMETSSCQAACVAAEIVCTANCDRFTNCVRCSPPG